MYENLFKEHPLRRCEFNDSQKCFPPFETFQNDISLKMYDQHLRKKKNISVCIIY